MVIYLKHEKHGTKVACSDAEAKADEKNGWTRYTVAGRKDETSQPLKEEKLEVTPSVVSREELAGQYEVKFGKKPHHRMSLATMQSQLAA